MGRSFQVNGWFCWRNTLRHFAFDAVGSDPLRLQPGWDGSLVAMAVVKKLSTPSLSKYVRRRFTRVWKSRRPALEIDIEIYQIGHGTRAIAALFARES